jgi:hypothetical protein
MCFEELATGEETNIFHATHTLEGSTMFLHTQRRIKNIHKTGEERIISILHLQGKRNQLMTHSKQHNLTLRPAAVRPRISRCFMVGLQIQLMRGSPRIALWEGSTKMTCTKPHVNESTLTDTTKLSLEEV